MKHYLWYKTDGSFGGPLTYQAGWPAGMDPSDPDDTDPLVVSNRENAEAQPDYDGILGYDCACTPPPDFCQCGVDRVGDSYAGGTPKVVTTKTAVVLELATVAESSNDYTNPLDKTPSASLTFKLTGSQADGETAELVQIGPALHASLPQTLTFTAGETNEITLKVPAQGVAGGICIIGKDVPRLQFWLRGWAA